MKRENVKALREGAMMVALTVVLIILNKYVPMFSVIGVFLCGVPMAALASRNGFKVTVPAVAAVCMVAILIDGRVLSALSTVVTSIIPGIVAGYMLGKKKSFFYTFFATSFAVCVGWIFQLLMIKLFMGQGIEELFASVVSETRTMMDEAMQSMGKTLEKTGTVYSKEVAEKFFKDFESVTKMYFPSIVVVSSMLSAYVMIRISGFVIKRANLAAIEVLPFSMLKAPRSIAVVGVVSYLIYMFSDTNGIFGSVLTNIVFVLYAILGVCGLSLVDFSMKKKIKAAPVRCLIYILIVIFGGLLIGIISNFLIIIGILDSNSDFRRIGDCGKTEV